MGGRVRARHRVAARGGLDAVIREENRFRPWVVLDRLDDLRHLGTRLGADGDAAATVTYRELEGPGALRFLVSSADGRTLARRF